MSASEVATFVPRGPPDLASGEAARGHYGSAALALGQSIVVTMLATIGHNAGNGSPRPAAAPRFYRDPALCPMTPRLCVQRLSALLTPPAYMSPLDTFVFLPSEPLPPPDRSKPTPGSPGQPEVRRLTVGPTFCCVLPPSPLPQALSAQSIRSSTLCPWHTSNGTFCMYILHALPVLSGQSDFIN